MNLASANHFCKRSSVFAVQDSISEKMAEALQLKLTNEEQKRLSKRYTENIEAYQLYLKGRYYWDKRASEAIKQAIEYFNRAIEIDPGYALAYSGLADCYNLQGLRDADPKEAFPKAKAMALKALEIDDTLAEAHASLGFVKHRFDWDFAGAEKEFKRALELNPNYATAHQWYAFYFASIGKFTEAIEEMRRAQEFDPLSLEINADLGLMLSYARQ
jgi:Tfp pilus assembly protein PilF